MCVVVYFIIMKQTLSQLSRAVSIKLLDFFLSFSSLFFKFDSSLKQAVNRNWVYLRFKLQFSFDYFEPELNRSHVFIIERLFLIISWDIVIIEILNILPVLLLIQATFAGSWIVADVHKKIQLEDWRFVYVFLHPDISRKFTGLKDGFGSIIEQLVFFVLSMLLILIFFKGLSLLQL